MKYVPLSCLSSANIKRFKHKEAEEEFRCDFRAACSNLFECACPQRTDVDQNERGSIKPRVSYRAGREAHKGGAVEMKRRARVISVWHSNCRKYSTKDPLSYSLTCLIPYSLASASSCFHYSKPSVWPEEGVYLPGAPY